MSTAAPPTPKKRSRRSRPTRSCSPAPPVPSGAPARIRELLAPTGAPRELISRAGVAGSTLIIDRDAATGFDERLVAHLGADEPAGNAALICHLYAEAAPQTRRCRPVEERDALNDPIDGAESPLPGRTGEEVVSVESAGASFRLQRLSSRMSIPELRWTVSSACRSDSQTVSLRDAIAAAEDYQPFCSITIAAVAAHAVDPSVSTTTLRAELARVLDSPIVLNRALREAVLARVGRDQSSLSEIAIRCGRVKRDSRGNQSGETSWLARRIGILPEGGQSEPTVWVHSDVLGLIAREGLAISPLEVELG
jgi:hypothetical protein